MANSSHQGCIMAIHAWVHYDTLNIVELCLETNPQYVCEAVCSKFQNFESRFVSFRKLSIATPAYDKRRNETKRKISFLYFPILGHFGL